MGTGKLSLKIHSTLLRPRGYKVYLMQSPGNQTSQLDRPDLCSWALHLTPTLLALGKSSTREEAYVTNNEVKTK